MNRQSLPTESLLLLRRYLEKDIEMAKKYYIPFETEDTLDALQSELDEVNSELSKRGID